ncbi:hypothetical protein [Streptomyces sp. NPDC058757]|uniref:phage tail protein n=1 Tax=Streptomyces sp. NPDC058757 TaxID=3346626 RepID=UPI0036948D11
MKEVPEKKPTGRTPAGAPAPAPAPGLSPHGVQRLQGAVGNAAVARLVAQRYTAPVKTPPNAAPGFRRVGADVAAKKRTMAAHAPAAAESKSAQDAAVAPPDDKEAQGKAANAEKMNAAKPGEFDKAAFVAAVDKAIEAQAPKNLDEADKFSKSGKADKVKDEVDGKVTDGRNASAQDIDTATKAPPDTSAAKDKPVTPMAPDNAPGNPGAPSAADAVPQKQPPEVTDFSEGPAENDKAMADAEVTEEQLAKGNEPEFDDALKAKKTAETDSAKAPGRAHTAEDRQLATAKAGAAAAGAQTMDALTATRAAAGKAVDGGKGETKSKDERKRAEVTAKLQKVFDATKKDVEATLTGLDQKVDTAFTTGEKSARDAFTADHKARMKKYKDKRYGGFLGKGRWLKDKFAGMPKEANDLYQESRKLYVARMRTVISQVADLIGVELGRAKTRIAQGRTELKAEVDRLPADLKAFGEEARQDFAGKFEDLEATVDEKSEQLVQDLANKYTAALNAVDEEIKKLQEANKGLIDKAKDAIAGVIKTINELKNLLLGILAKAASAIMKIIKDPIGFLGNLVKAVGAGLDLFVANIGEHLKKGLVSWLLGTAAKAGLELPERFDLRGIITLITSLLGLTWDNIRTRITRKGVPEEAFGAVETSVPVAKKLATEGPAGAFEEIKAETGDLKPTILSKLTEYLVPTVIIAGITWIVSLLNPASAFVRAVKGIIDIVTFVVNQGAQIADFVNAVLDAVIAIANGGAAGVPKMVEGALAAGIPLLIGFLASLLGIGNLANKVKSVFQAASRPVNRAMDKIVDFIAKKGKALWQKLKGPGRGSPERPDRPRAREKEISDADLNSRVVRELKIRNLADAPADEVPHVLDAIARKFKKFGLKEISTSSMEEGESKVSITASPSRVIMTLHFLRALVSGLSSRFRLGDLRGGVYGSKKSKPKYGWITARVPTVAIGALKRSDGFREYIRGESKSSTKAFKKAVEAYFKAYPNGGKPIPDIIADSNHRGWHAEEQILASFTGNLTAYLSSPLELAERSPNKDPWAHLMIKVTRSPCPLCATLMDAAQVKVRKDWHKSFKIITSAIGLYAGGGQDFTFRRPIPTVGPRDGGNVGIGILQNAGIEQQILTRHDASFDDIYAAYRAGRISYMDMVGFVKMMFGRNRKYAAALLAAVGQVNYTRRNTF